MTSTTRLPKAEIKGPVGWVLTALIRRQFGAVPEAVTVLWHNRPVLFATARFGRQVSTWHRLDRNLQTYAHMVVASLVGCSWCLDFTYSMAHVEGLDEAKASEVPRWRESTVFTPLERDVMEYAEAMSETPPRVTDDVSERLLRELGAPALVELAAIVGFANSTTRANIALGIESEGFSTACTVPLAPPPDRTATSA
jgi:AhpD family alkylhydroperoxidase